MDPQVGRSLDDLSFIASSTIYLCNSFHGYFVALLRRTKVSTLWSSFFLSFMWSVNCILDIWSFWANIHLPLNACVFFCYWITSLRMIFSSSHSSIAIPSAMEACSFCSTPSPASAVTWVFYLSHSDWCEVDSCFDLHFLDDIEHFFRCFSAIRYSSGENSLFSSEPHFLMGLFLIEAWNLSSSTEPSNCWILSSLCL